MFRRTENNLPQDPDYPTDLRALGFKINEVGQFVSIDDGESFFHFFATDNDRANDVRKERIYGCVRQTVLSSLAAQGVKQLHVYGNRYSEEKPDKQHTTILATDLEKLKEKRDVVVVINEHMQDLGIWAYRLLLGEPGIRDGSAVGLVKALKAWGTSKTTYDSVAGDDSLEQAVRKLNLDGASAEADGESVEHNTPGLIILNPGQLLYSHAQNKCMSQAEWMGRHKPSALVGHHRIDEAHNRVPGHENPDKHVAAAFDHVISYITRDDVRLYVVGLSEGGEAVLKYLDSKFSADPQDPVGNKIEAIALMQPSHNHEQLKSQALKTFLAGRRCRAYIMSDYPKGELLITPRVATPVALANSGASLEASQHSIKHHREGSETSTSPAIAIPGTFPPGTPAQESTYPGIYTSTGSLTHPRSLEAKSSPATHPHNTTALQSSIISQHASESTTSLPTGIPLNGSLASASPYAAPGSSYPTGTDALEKSVSTLSNSLALRKQREDDENPEPNPYADEVVSCPTFSAGPVSEGVTELVWPGVMETVVEWFEDVAEEVEGMGRQAAERERVRREWAEVSGHPGERFAESGSGFA